MCRRLLFLPLFAALPALLCAQQPKLINCRTLEAAGNFVGPDEVIVDDLVCQKAKPGAQTNVSSQVPKPIPGVVISGGDSGNVVDAAKAASQRVAAAKDAIREKVGQAGEQVTPAVPPAEATPSSAPDEAPATPPPAAAEAAPPAPQQPPLEPAAAVTTSVPQPQAPPDNSANASKSEPAGATETSMTPAAPEGAISRKTPTYPTTSEPSAKSEAAPVAAPLQPAAAPEPPAASEPESAPPRPAATAPPAANPAETPAPAQPASAPEPPPAEAGASPEIVLKSSSTSEQPAPANTPPPAAETPSSAPSATPTAEAPKPAEAAAPAGATGFYDANAGANVVTNPRPGDPANAPAAEPRERSEAELAAVAAAKSAAEEAEESLRAPDPNLPRERVVETGAFAEPKEVGPDPSTLAHKTTFHPGDIEGFEEGHRAGCTKNITIAGLKGEKLVLGTPGWAERWIEKNQKRMPEMCFSDTPMTTAKNYLIVFYTAPSNTNATQVADPTATPQGAPAGGVGAFTLSYGSTWHYAQERNVGVTVLTRDEADEPQAELGKVWYATAYTEEGVPVSEHWPEKAKKPVHVDEKDTKSKKAREARAEMERVSDDLLDQMVGDIAKL